MNGFCTPNEARSLTVVSRSEGGRGDSPAFHAGLLGSSAGPIMGLLAEPMVTRLLLAGSPAAKPRRCHGFGQSTRSTLKWDRAFERPSRVHAPSQVLGLWCSFESARLESSGDCAAGVAHYAKHGQRTANVWFVNPAGEVMRAEPRVEQETAANAERRMNTTRLHEPSMYSVSMSVSRTVCEYHSPSTWNL